MRTMNERKFGGGEAGQLGEDEDELPSGAGPVGRPPEDLAEASVRPESPAGASAALPALYPPPPTGKDLERREDESTAELKIPDAEPGKGSTKNGLVRPRKKKSYTRVKGERSHGQQMFFWAKYRESYTEEGSFFQTDACSP